ncbi:ABC transporter permease [Cohnella silvisoli]
MHKSERTGKWSTELPLHLMVLPAAVLIAIFSYGPMVGLTIAFQDFNPSKGFFGSPFNNLDNFRYVLQLPDLPGILFNTVYISMLKIVAGGIVPILFAVLLNEVRVRFFKRTVQTLVYLPHFLSWVLLGGILIEILSPSSGIVNAVLGFFGIEPVFFLGDYRIFPYVLVATDVWKEFGFGTIVYLAALTAVDPRLYEACVIDGGNRWKQTIHVTIPALFPVIILLLTLSLGNILNAGFDQVFNLYSPLVYRSGDVIDTAVYRMGLLDMQFGVATAVGLFKSVVSLVFISLSYFLAYRLAGYRIF